MRGSISPRVPLILTLVHAVRVEVDLGPTRNTAPQTLRFGSLQVNRSPLTRTPFFTGGPFWDVEFCSSGREFPIGFTGRSIELLLALGSTVDHFCGVYFGSYKVIPK